MNSPSTSKVFMADACHLHFGKYMLFLCYGVTANSNASPVAFAILFQNKNTSARGDSFGNTVLNYIHASILPKLRSSPARTRARKTQFPSIFDRWDIFTVCIIVGRILSRCAEEVVGKFPTPHFGCTISCCAAALLLSSNTISMSTSRQ